MTALPTPAADTAELFLPLRPPVAAAPRSPGRLHRLLEAADLTVAAVLVLSALAAGVLFAGPVGFFVCVFLLAQAAIALHPPVWRLSVHHDQHNGGTR